MNGQKASHRGGDDMAQRHREPVDVHPILRRGGKVLLSRRAGDTYASGLLHVPSGHLDGDFEDVVTGLVNASLVLPEATETYFPHMSAAYGKVATHYPNQMDRADALASALLRHARHHVTLRVKSVWLGWNPNIPAATPTRSNGSRSCPWGAEQRLASASRHPSPNHHAVGADAPRRRRTRPRKEPLYDRSDR